MQTFTVRAHAVAQETDSAGYTTYVFYLLDNHDRINLNNTYIMCVRWPNWEHAAVKLFQRGFLSITYLVEGVDTWYDSHSEKFVPYKTTCIQFNKFIPEQPDNHHDFVL